MKSWNNLVGRMKMKKESIPYGITIENTYDQEKEVTILGHNIVDPGKNSGNEEGIKLTSSFSSYRHICCDIAQNPCKIELIYVMSQNTRAAFPQIYIVQHEATGEISKSPHTMFLDPFQQQGTVSTKKVNFNLDGNSYLTFMVPAKVTMSIYLYPTQRVTISDLLDFFCLKKAEKETQQPAYDDFFMPNANNAFVKKPFLQKIKEWFVSKKIELALWFFKIKLKFSKAVPPVIK